MSVKESSSLEHLSVLAAGGGDITKITNELQKIKTQNSILKKAVLQEQQKVSELERELKATELRLRTSMEENDILQFNNTRLTKRVSSLQDELSDKNKSSDGGWFFGSSRELTKKIEELEILRSELRVKIKENEQMHYDTQDLQQDLDQAKQVHQEQVATLKECVKAKQDEAEGIIAQMAEMKGRMARAQEELDRVVNAQRDKDNKLSQDTKQFMESMRQARLNLRKNVGDDSKGNFPLSLSVDDLIHDIKGDDEELQPALQLDSGSSGESEEGGPSEVSVLFGTLSQAVAAHWMAHRDKLELERKKGLWKSSEQLYQICAELQTILPTLPQLLDRVAHQAPHHLPLTGTLPPKLREDLQHFLHACKKWLTYQQLRHQELSQLALPHSPTQPAVNYGTGPNSGPNPNLAQIHKALSETYLAIFHVFDRLVADREQQSMVSLVTFLEELAAHSAALAQIENEKEPDIIPINEQLIAAQTRALSLVSDLASAISTAEVQKPQAGGPSAIRRSFGVQGSPRSPSVGGFRFRNATIYLNRLVEDCQLIIQHRDERVEALKQEISSLQAQLISSQDALSSRQAQINSLLAELKSARTKSEQMNEQVQTLKKQIQDQQQANEQLIKTLQQKLDDEVQKLVQAEKALRAKTEEFNIVQSKLSNHEQHSLDKELKLRTDYETSQQTIRNLEHKVHDVEISLEAKVVQAHTLQQRLYAVEQRASESAKQVSVLERNLADKNRAIQELHNSPADLDGAEGLRGSAGLKKLDDDVATTTATVIKDDENTASPQVISREPVAHRRNSSSVARYEMTVMDATGQQSNSLSVGETDKERERALVQHYETRAVGLIAQAQAADAKALQLYDQHAGLLNALYEKEREKEALMNKISEAKAEGQQAKDDLEDTRHNYDNQIHIMTEHIIGLQDSVSKVEVELGDLKSHKVQCAKCKAWNTLEWLVGEGKGGQKCIKGGHAVTPFML